MKCLGLMSGTSMDGVDCALVEITGSGHHLRVAPMTFRTQRYRPDLRERILVVAERGTVADVCHLNVVIGEVFARVALHTISEAGLVPQDIHVIGSHGQTVYHRPDPIKEPGIGAIRSSLQIGEPAVIAERTGITTVANFRARDLATGGQGAPLTPYAHYVMFRHRRRSRLIVNLGGIANITYLPAGGTLEEVTAFDTGPCNMLLDGLVSLLTKGRQACDQGGRLALKGTVHPDVLAHLIDHPFVKQRPPKTTGREQFGHPYAQEVSRTARRLRVAPEDLLATCCQGIAWSVGDARRWLGSSVDEVIVGGGGVRNRALMKQLASVFAPVPLKGMEEAGYDSKAFEAMAFATLAYQTLRGRCSNISAATGAKTPVVLGTIVPGRGWP